MQTRIKKIDAIFILFVLLLACGILQIVVGLSFVPTVATFQLDVVLSPAELQDEDLRNRALKSIEQAAERYSMFWTIAPGLFVAVLSSVGLYLTFRHAYRTSRNNKPSADST